MAFRYLALKPFLSSMSRVLGPELSREMRVSVVGGVHMEALGLRPTKDADVLIPKKGPWNRFKIINEVAKDDPRFTVNMEAKCGLTFKDGGDFYTLDLIDDEVAKYLPEGTALEEAVRLETAPLPYVVEAIKLKLFAAGDRLILKKAIKDLDDVALLLTTSWKEGIEMGYADKEELENARDAFDAIWTRYHHAKTNNPEEGGTVWTEAQWREFLKLDKEL